MEMTINSETQSKKFVPFTVNMTINCIEEARLLYHVFNRADLLTTLKEEVEDLNRGWNSYEWNSFESFIAETFRGDYFLIKDEIKRQGFKL